MFGNAMARKCRKTETETEEMKTETYETRNIKVHWKSFRLTMAHLLFTMATNKCATPPKIPVTNYQMLLGYDLTTYH